LAGSTPGRHRHVYDARRAAGFVPGSSFSAAGVVYVRLITADVGGAAARCQDGDRHRKSQRKTLRKTKIHRDVLL
jgi:hypothetical protein